MPAFKTEVISSQKIKIDNNTKAVAYIFFNVDCPCSNAHLDHLKKLAQKYTDIKFFGVHSNKSSSPNKVKEYFENAALPFPVVDDRDLSIANELGALKTPHVFLFDENQQLVFQGGATSSRNPLNAKHFFLKDALYALTHDQPQPIKEARTIGCYIQR